MNIARAAWLVALFAGAAACDRPVTPDDAATADAGVDARRDRFDAGPPDARPVARDAGPFLVDAGACETASTITLGEPITAPAETWTFVPFPDAHCMNGESTGIGINLSDASSPSAGRLSDIQAILAASKAICVFPEIGRDPKFIAALSDGLNVRVGTPQDIEFIELAVGPGQYEVLLRALATSITDCLTQG